VKLSYILKQSAMLTQDIRCLFLVSDRPNLQTIVILVRSLEELIMFLYKVLAKQMSCLLLFTKCAV